MQELLSTSPIITMVNRHQSASTPLNDQDQIKQDSLAKQTQFQFNGSKQQDENSSSNTNNNNNESNNSSPSFHQDYSTTANEYYKANLFQPAIKIETTSTSLNNSNFSVNNLTLKKPYLSDRDSFMYTYLFLYTYLRSTAAIKLFVCGYNPV